jgi:hypothetical protein
LTGTTANGQRSTANDFVLAPVTICMLLNFTFLCALHLASPAVALAPMIAA